MKIKKIKTDICYHYYRLCLRKVLFHLLKNQMRRSKKNIFKFFSFSSIKSKVFVQSHSNFYTNITLSIYITYVKIMKIGS